MKRIKPNSLESGTEATRAEWLRLLASLVDRVEVWATESGWSTRRIEKRIRDSQLGAYPAPALLLQKETIRVLLEPITHAAPGANGVVDLYLMPAYDDIASLYHRSGKWHVHYMFPGSRTVGSIGDADSKPLTKQLLLSVLNEMTKNVIDA